MESPYKMFSRTELMLDNYFSRKQMYIQGGNLVKEEVGSRPRIVWKPPRQRHISLRLFKGEGDGRHAKN